MYITTLPESTLLYYLPITHKYTCTHARARTEQTGLHKCNRTNETRSAVRAFVDQRRR